MSQISIPQPVRRSSALLFTLPLVLFLAIAGWFGWRTWHSGPTDTSSAAITPSSPEIEARWGIRVRQIGVSADGGIVDFRYQIIDPDKALAITSDMSNVPVLIDENSGTLVNSAALMVHKHDLVAGQTYFYLYRNTNGSIKRGNLVTVKVGDLKLEHVVAK